MAGLLNRLAPKGYPGQIFVCMLRYGYGNQTHIEKMELLHSWYSHLRAYLPVKYGAKSDEYNKILEGGEDGKDRLVRANEELINLFNVYDAAFEKETCTGQEKEFIKSLWSVYERLDEITARAKIIDDLKTEEEAFNV